MELKNYKVLSFQYVILFLSLSIMGLGIAFAIKANLGIFPISCIPYILSLEFTSLTVGEFTILFHILFFILEIIILRKNFRISQLVQIPILLVFGFIIDFFVWCLSGLTLTNYFLEWFFCLLGMCTLALGVFLCIKINVGYLPIDGFVQVISKVLDIPFGKIKVVNDILMVVISIILSLSFFSQFIGVREGTIVSAILIGYIIRFYERILGLKIDYLKDKIINSVS